MLIVSGSFCSFVSRSRSADHKTPPHSILGTFSIPLLNRQVLKNGTRNEQLYKIIPGFENYECEPWVFCLASCTCFVLLVAAGLGHGGGGEGRRRGQGGWFGSRRVVSVFGVEHLQFAAAAVWADPGGGRMDDKCPIAAGRLDSAASCCLRGPCRSGANAPGCEGG